ncbi:peptidoglycan DD-metalloendopeptidase family protein [Gangjinia marincola]|uniref:Peptidoglycan DD-metalloendopeptidase family protein n=1 Tax=Gangjinia marincola TaxID=578463 RepID=A0ABN1MJ25_9FLAO
MCVVFSCKEDDFEDLNEHAYDVESVIDIPKLTEEFGFILDHYEVIRDTIKKGETFGVIMDTQGVSSQTVFEVVEQVKETFNPARLRAGKPYTILKSKDSLATVNAFIYEENSSDYMVIDFTDKVCAYSDSKPITIIEKSASGIIDNNLSSTFDDLGLNIMAAYKLSDIYAWTINFFKLQKGDRFKIIYTEKYINDTIRIGFDDIKAAYFVHHEKPIYAFRFQADTTTNVIDYYDDETNNLRRAFLKGPLKFNRISSRYNLKRRIKYYGYKVRPHKGTDFAGRVGTPIMATADGVVTKSEYRGGNGNYVKIRHNGTYETQYLHMQKRLVKPGDFVQQGDVIGTIGMTGNTGGPHVCYRFWKNGRQVNPLTEDLPASEPMPDSIKPRFQEYILPIKDQLDQISF